MTQSIPSVYIPQTFARQVVCYTFQRSAPPPPGVGGTQQSLRHVHGEASPRGPTPYLLILWRIQGEGQGGPDLPYQTLHLFGTEILTSKGLYITF